jgi:hypothetical protein
MFSDTPTWPAKAISQAQANSTVAAVVVGQDAALRPQCIDHMDQVHQVLHRTSGPAPPSRQALRRDGAPMRIWPRQVDQDQRHCRLRRC